AGQVITRIHAIIFTAIPSLGNNMQIKNLKIGARLGMAFGLLLILMGFMTFMGIWKLQQVAHATELMDEATVKERLAQEWVRGIATNGIRTFSRLKTNNPEEETKLKEEMAVVSAQVTKYLQELEPMITSDEGKRLLGVVVDQRKKYNEARDLAYKQKAEG